MRKLPQIRPRRRLLPGLTFVDLKNNYSLIPLLGITIVGVSMGVFSLVRWFICNPEVQPKPSDRKSISKDNLEMSHGYHHPKLIQLHDYTKIQLDPYRPKLD